MTYVILNTLEISLLFVRFAIFPLIASPGHLKECKAYKLVYTVVFLKGKKNEDQRLDLPPILLANQQKNAKKYQKSSKIEKYLKHSVFGYLFLIPYY